MELLKAVGIEKLTYLRKYKPYGIGLSIASTVILLPLGIANATNYSLAISLVLNIVLALFLLSVIIFSTYYGRKLLHMLGSLLRPTEKFMKRVTKCQNSEI
jgi:hypothetical protein